MSQPTQVSILATYQCGKVVRLAHGGGKRYLQAAKRALKVLLAIKDHNGNIMTGCPCLARQCAPVKVHKAINGRTVLTARPELV